MIYVTYSWTQIRTWDTNILKTWGHGHGKGHGKNILIDNYIYKYIIHKCNNSLHIEIYTLYFMCKIYTLLCTAIIPVHTHVRVRYTLIHLVAEMYTSNIYHTYIYVNVYNERERE